MCIIQVLANYMCLFVSIYVSFTILYNWVLLVFVILLPSFPSCQALLCRPAGLDRNLCSEATLIGLVTPLMTILLVFVGGFLGFSMVFDGFSRVGPYKNI